MQTPDLYYLQNRAITGPGSITLDAPPHPDKGAIIAYVLTVEATLTDPGGAPKAADWGINALLYSSGGANSGFLETLLAGVSLNAPRVGGDIVESNISGRDLALLYQGNFGRDIYRSPDVTTAVAGASRAVSFEVIIPFYDPLINDPMWASIPSYLLKGDVTLKVTTTSLSTTIANGNAGSAGGTSTFSNVQLYWSALIQPCSGNEVPVMTKIKKSVYSSDTIDIGPGTPLFVADMRNPEATSGNVTDYQVYNDGTPVQVNARPRQLLGSFLHSVNPTLDSEPNAFTPLLWLARNVDPHKFDTSGRNMSIKLNGASSATILSRICFRPNETIEARVAAANGLPPPGVSGVVALPKAPAGHEVAQVNGDIAAAGPRVILIHDGTSLNPPKAVESAVPKVTAVASQVVDTGGLAKKLNKGFGRVVNNAFFKRFTR